MIDSDIKRLIKILEESEIDELEVSTFWGKQKICLRKKTTIQGHDIEVPNTVSHKIPEEENKTLSISSINEKDEITISNPAEINIDNESHLHIENTITIKAPLIGTFYRSPKPDTPPFISEGDEIKEGQIICVIEAMKIFNEIESEYAGKILKILVKDASPVEYDQDLMIISPA